MASAYKNCPEWIKRMEALFDQTDRNKDGFLSIEDFTLWSDNLERQEKSDPVLIQKSRQATREFWESTGLKPGVKLTKEQFIDGMIELALIEKAKHLEDNEDSVHVRYIESIFDVFDTNQTGFIELDEYERLLLAANYDAGSAKIVFDIVDANHDGKISRKELRNYNTKFWFFPEGTEATGMYGPKF